MTTKIAICRHVKADGRPCGSPALRGRAYCYYHYRARVDARRVRPTELPLLESPEAVQSAIDQVTRALLQNAIDAKRAGLLLYALQIAAYNIRHAHFDAHRDRYVLDLPTDPDSTPDPASVSAFPNDTTTDDHPQL